jgi:hypothetical protein
LSSAEAELKAAIYGEKEMMLAESLIKFLGFEIRAKIIWTDSSAARSVMTRLGTGSKMKHLQAAELYLQEKVRMKELEVLKCSTSWNPADVLTKFVSEELMKKYLGLMGMVVWDDSEVVSTCVENTYGGRFSTNTMRTWFKRTMVLGMMGTVKAGDTCLTGDCEIKVHSNHLKANTPDSMMWLYVMLFLMLLCILLGCVGGWRLRGWLTAPTKEKAIRGPAPKKQVKTMMVQSQTRYAWDRADPRFVPLVEREHGAWGPFL